MNYYINPACLTAAFTLPVAVVDNHLKFAKSDYLKVLLFVMRNMLNDVSETEISVATDLSEYDVKEALLYWADAGILCPKEVTPEVKREEKTKAVTRSAKPSRSDVAKRGNEDPKIRYLLHETEQKLGRVLKGNETSTLVWLYDDQGLDVSLILLIVQYAVAHNRANMRFIESTAVAWVNKGISSVTEADEELRIMAVSEQAWGIVSKTFGLEKRMPGKKEEELCYKWVEEFGFSREMLLEAYETCVNATSKLSFAYIDKVLKEWHKKGYKALKDIEEKPKAKKQEDNISAIDFDLFEKMISSKD